MATLGQQRQTAERVVRGRTVVVTIRHRGVERSSLITALNSYVGVGVECVVVGVHEVVLDRRIGNHRIVDVFDGLAVEAGTPAVVGVQPRDGANAISIQVELVGVLSIARGLVVVVT